MALSTAEMHFNALFRQIVRRAHPLPRRCISREPSCSSDPAAPMRRHDAGDVAKSGTRDLHQFKTKPGFRLLS
jgi:hypothetical protein